MKILIRASFLFEVFLVLLFLQTFAKMEDENCKPEDATNMAISFRLFYKGE